MFISKSLLLFFYVSSVFCKLVPNEKSILQFVQTNITTGEGELQPIFLAKTYSFFLENKNIYSTTHEQISLNMDSDSIVRLFQISKPQMILGKNISGLQLPNIKDKKTILSLASLSNNIHFQQENPRALNISDSQKRLDKVAFKGYVYTNPSKRLIIVDFKGTSTITKVPEIITADKYNYNFMFSCCCSCVDFTWNPVCPCQVSGSICSQTCLVDYAQQRRITPFRNNYSIFSEKYFLLYYYQAVELYLKLSEEYPLATIWLTGHSIWGSIAALLALKFPGSSAITFASPGERLFAEHLGLVPSRFSSDKLESTMANVPIFHFYDASDPIPTGKCTGLWSFCYLAGYALETRCHTGAVCEFESDRVPEYNIKKHELSSLIEKIKQSEEMPRCRLQDKCSDCDSWVFV